MRNEAVEFGDTGVIACWFRLWRDGLQGEHFAAPLRADGHSVGHRMAMNVFEWVFFETVEGEIACVFISFQDATPFRKTGCTFTYLAQ